MIQELLHERKLPELKSREEMLRILAQEEYGPMPPAPVSVEAVELEPAGRTSQCAGHAVYSEYKLIAHMPEGFNVAFPIRCLFPKDAPAGSVPTFVFINFRPDITDWQCPATELADEGFGVITLQHNEVSADQEDDFSGGIAPGLIAAYGRTGKISLWAWACSRALDYALARADVDPTRVAVIGHSRLGKTALWCGANDERFSMVVSNNSGCSGAAISRGKVGESIEVITRVFPRWFHGTCYSQYAEREYEAPFDQHYLLACIAPRKLCVGSASEDTWADPNSEYLGCCAASPAWEQAGKTGFVHPDRLPVAVDVLQEGNISYHLTQGTHYLGRNDWHQYMKFLKK